MNEIAASQLAVLDEKLAAYAAGGAWPAIHSGALAAARVAMTAIPNI